MRRGEGDWEILFTPSAEAAAETLACAVAGSDDGTAEHWPTLHARLDNRGLMPPEPMVRILPTLETLPPGAALEAWNDREPLHLYRELEACGADIRMKREADGVRLLIRRNIPHDTPQGA